MYKIVEQVWMLLWCITAWSIKGWNKIKCEVKKFEKCEWWWGGSYLTMDQKKPSEKMDGMTNSTPYQNGSEKHESLTPRGSISVRVTVINESTY